MVQRYSFIIRLIWAACLLVGGMNHARILAQHGLFWDYGGVSLPSAIYWSSLTILDPLVAALLFVRPKVGIIATILLIVTNVAHNLYITADRALPGEFLTHVANPFVTSQITFMLFVLATAHVAWRGVDTSHVVDADSAI